MEDAKAAASAASSAAAEELTQAKVGPEGEQCSLRHTTRFEPSAVGLNDIL